MIRRYTLNSITADKPLRILLTEEINGEIVKLYLLLGDDISPETRIEILTSDGEKLCDLKSTAKEILLYPRNFNVTREKELNSGLEPRFQESSISERFCNTGYLVIRLSNVALQDFNKVLIKTIKVIVKE